MFRELGETQGAYIDSFSTFELGPPRPCDIPGVEHSLDRIRSWYVRRDEELYAALRTIPDEDVDRPVDRGNDNPLPVWIHLDVFREALIIFYRRFSVYLKAAGKHRPERFERWIG